MKVKFLSKLILKCRIRYFSSRQMWFIYNPCGYMSFASTGVRNGTTIVIIFRRFPLEIEQRFKNDTNAIQKYLTDFQRGSVNRLAKECIGV